MIRKNSFRIIKTYTNKQRLYLALIMSYRSKEFR